MAKPRKKKPEWVKRAAKRAELRSKGEDPSAVDSAREPSPLDPPLSGAGRPTDYDPEFCDEARLLCQDGATDEEVAQALNVHRATLYRWKARYPEFRDALKAGKEACDERVERSLYERAVGYTFDSVKIFMPAGAKEAVIVPHKEHVPPDVGAQKLWLSNRQPDRWREIKTHELDATSTFVELLKAITQRAPLQIEARVIEGSAA